MITDLTLSELQQEFSARNLPGYRALQVWEGLYSTLVGDYSAITSIPTTLRNELSEKIAFPGLNLVTLLESSDKQTIKILLESSDKKKVETVLMRYSERNTLCVSTQSGCAMNCSFCATGQMGFFRSLSPGEIIEQVLFFSRQLKLEGKKPTNIVFMGMGEPFHNYEAVMKAITILGDESGFNFGARRMTISTVGLIPQIIRFADEKSQVNLAVSLHAVDNELRSQMMPINKKYPVEELLKACAYYIEKTHRRISFEWAMVEGVNDSPEMARTLSNKVKHLLCHVNLIQLNPSGKFTGKGSSMPSVIQFREILEKNGIPCSIRLKRGIDINAGCGQLASSEN